MGISREKVELVLILQAHAPDEQVDQKIISMVIYSQLRILQIILSNYRDTPILDEGRKKILSLQSIDPITKILFKAAFHPSAEAEKLKELDFNELVPKQKEKLSQIGGADILLYLGLIDKLYPAESVSQSVDIEKFSESSGAVSYRLRNTYSALKVKPYENNIEFKYECITLEEQRQYAEFNWALRHHFPEVHEHREKAALDNVLKYAEFTKKKQVVLIFGAGHLAGFKHLIATDYKDRITLKTVINTTLGHNGPLELRFIERVKQEGLKAYKAKKLEEAAEYFKQVLEFWDATYAKTERKYESQLSAEYNLGSALLDFATTHPDRLLEAVTHLNNAHELAAKLKFPADNKYTKRYETAKNALPSENPPAPINFSIAERSVNTNPLNIYQAAVEEVKKAEAEHLSAIDKFKQAKLAFQAKGGCHLESSKCMSGIISCYRNVRDYAAAIQCAEESIVEFSPLLAKAEMESIINKYYECLMLQKTKATDLYKNAITNYKNKQFHLAICQLNYILEVPKDVSQEEAASCHSTLASCYREIKSYEAAKDHCEKALALKTRHSPSDPSIGNLRQKLQDILKLCKVEPTTRPVFNI